MASKLISLKDLRKHDITAGRHTLRRWWLSGQMPRPKKLGARLVWREDELLAWIDSLPPATAKKAKGGE